MATDGDAGVIAGSVLGTLAFVALVFIAYYYSGCSIRNIFKFRYNVVDHSLDDEEIEFKKIIEMQSDDIEELFDIPDEELDFDVREKDRLSMIEAYRQNLVNASNSQEASDVIDEDALRL